jgi:hypothetical protein
MAGMIFLIVVHVTMVFLLYGSRALVRSFAVPSEFVVFLFPAVIAFTGHYVLLRAGSVRMIPPWAAACPRVFLSFWLSLFLAFNAYGT